jgi:peptidoglycan hydrolase CwlO-like protein
VSVGPSDPTTQRYLQQAQSELSDMQNSIATLNSQIDDLVNKRSVDEQRAAELQRLIADLKTP